MLQTLGYVYRERGRKAERERQREGDGEGERDVGRWVRGPCFFFPSS